MKQVSYLTTIVIFSVIGFVNSINGQYEVQSNFLKDPNIIIPFIMDSADFWKKSVDWQDGGFYTEVKQDGTPELTSRKSFVQCSRHAYGFSRAFMVSGDEEYLNYAGHAIQYVYDYGWDSQNGGWFFSSDKTGNPAPPYGGGWDPNEGKWSFQQHYDVLGISAMAEITRDKKHLEWFDKAVIFNDSLLWDSREGYEGYYDTADKNWSNKRNKSFTSTVDAITTWVLSRALLTNDQDDINRLIILADNIMDYLYESMFLNQVKIGFAESYNSNWTLNAESHAASTGHVIKTAWCLARAYMYTQNDDYLVAAQFMIDDMMDNGGYDYANGGLYGDLNWSTGSVNKSKNHWMLEQGLTGGLINYFLAEDIDDRDQNLELADGCIGFYMDHFIDQTNGECYTQTNSLGTVTNNDKSDPFKGGYHNIEMAYLTYLYGNLFVQNKSVDLFYKFDATTESRSIKMSPLAIVDDMLIISEVSLDGVNYTDFDSKNRVLTIPAGVSGKYKITYHLDGQVATDEPHFSDEIFVSPNPAHNDISINNSGKDVSLAIYSTAGQLMYSKDDIQNQQNIDISTFPNGMYIVELTSEGKTKFQKLIKH
ncbi:MAG: AGE family epimerase/isomerase [Saprospiraceae bacterium]